MTQQDVLKKLKEILMVRLRFDPQRAAEITLETTLPNTVEGSLGLDSLDILELLLGIEEEFKFVIDEREDLTAEFFSLDNLSRFVLAKTGHA
ncbi:MAG: acyl carrier protein [candidate division NC10 bacterium]